MRNGNSRHIGKSEPRGSNRTRSVEDVRHNILAAARKEFRHFGYERSSLEQIGAAVGLTRGAVLYHFRTKAELLEVLLSPFVDEVESMLEEFESAAAPPRPRVVLERLLDALLHTPAASDLLLRDTSGRHAVGLDTWADKQADRLILLISPGSDSDQGARVRGLSALGAITRPLAALPDPISAAERRAILTAAGNTLHTTRH